MFERIANKLNMPEIKIRQRNNKLFIAYLTKNTHEEYTFPTIGGASKEFCRLTGKQY